MEAEKIYIDGYDYNVFISYPSRVLNFELVEGENSGVTLDFTEKRDIGGTKFSYTMTVMPNPAAPEDFDALIDTVTAPVESHTVRMPYGQVFIEFKALIRSGSVTDYGVLGSRRVWQELQLNFEPVRPQRRPGGSV